MSQKLKNKTKKKIIIISAGMLILLLISIILTVTVLHFQNQEFASENANILYYSENQIAEEEEGGKENNVLVVGLNEENKTNEEENNEVTTNEGQGKKEQKADTPYYIKINNQANVVTVYKKDSKGEYTAAVKAMICSIGAATPESGVYSISDKYTWRLLQGDVYGQYACRITGHILFHSVPYEEKDKSTLEWWEYDKLGTKASLGCIRLTVQDAKWIYDNCVPGTKVEFYSSSNPGPLGKPTAMKISDDEEVRNWDPTDPDSANPWKKYLEEQETEEVSTKPVEDKKENEVIEKTETEKANVIKDDNATTNTTGNIVQNSVTTQNKTPSSSSNIIGGSSTNKQNVITSENKGNIVSNKTKATNEV